MIPSYSYFVSQYRIDIRSFVLFMIIYELKCLTLLFLSGARDMKDKHRENLAWRIRDAYQKSFKDPEKDLQTYLDVVLKCCEREELVIIGRLQTF